MSIKFTKFFILFLFVGISGVHAQAPNWSDDVAEIIYKNCSNCHNSKGIAPFELMSYNDAVKNSVMIKINVNNGTMPPWPPDPSYKRYSHERLLTATQIKTISDWVDASTPRGNIATEPAPPVINPGGQLPSPDLTVQIPTFTSTASNSDDYRCFVIPTGLLTDKYISQIEVIPGNGSIVHHVLMYSDVGSVCTTLDAGDPLPGYTSFGGTGDYDSELIGGWVPGQDKMQLPNGFGIKLPANSNIVLQIHYPAGSSGQQDSTKVKIKYTSIANPREVYIDSPLDNFSSSLVNGPLFIPANSVKTFYEKYTVPYHVTLFTTQPHMHLIGKNITSYAVTPAKDTIEFIRINHWDFHWQGQYQFQHAIKILAGTTLHATASYDNTSANPHNPNNPPLNVYAGESTTDEMMMVFFSYTLYKPGDENILLDSSLLTSNIPQKIEHSDDIKLYPNPSDTKISIMGLDESIPFESELYDSRGQLIRMASNPENIDISSLSTGLYMLRIMQNNTIKNLKFTKL